jgi:hypothetical protein
VTSALARSLLLADAVTREALAEALLVSATRGTSLVRALVATGAIEPASLEHHLERGDAPVMRHIVPVMSLVEHLPPGLCERLLALPVRRDPRTGTIDVAVVDARDLHAVNEVAYWLKAPVRMVRTSYSSMEAALRRIRKPENAPAGVKSLAPPIWVPSPSHHPPARTATPVYGTPLIAPHLEPAPAAPAGFTSPDPGGAHNIPIPLKQRDPAASFADLANGVGFDPPDGEAVLDLRRRKSLSPAAPTSLFSLRPDGTPAASPERGPGMPTTASVDRLPSLPPGFAPPASARDVGRFADQIRRTTDRDAILELVALGGRAVAERIAVLAVRKGVLAGWTCSPEMADRGHLRAARLPLEASQVLAGVLDNDLARMVRVPKDAAHAPLLAAFREPLSTEVALVTVRVDEKPVALVMADRLADPRSGLAGLEELARAAGDALSELLRARRK